MTKRIDLLGTFKSLRRNKGGTELVLTLDDEQWGDAAMVAATEGFLLKLTIEVQAAQTFGKAS